MFGTIQMMIMEYFPEFLLIFLCVGALDFVRFKIFKKNER